MSQAQIMREYVKHAQNLPQTNRGGATRKEICVPLWYQHDVSVQATGSFKEVC